MNFFTRKSNTKSIKKEEKHTFEDYFRMFDRLYGVFGVRPFLKTKTNKFFDVYVKVYRLALVIVSLNWAYGSIVKIFEPKLQFFLKVPHFAFLFYVFEGVFKYSVASFNHKAIVDVIETLREMYLKHELANTVKLSPDAPYYEIVYWQAKKGYQEKLQSTGKLIKLSIIGWLMAGVSYIIMPILVVIIRLIITGDLKPQYGLDTTYLIDFHGKWVLIMIVEDIYEASADINLAIPDGVICMIINHISANFEVLGADFQRLLNSKGISYTEKLDKVGEIIQRHNDLIKLSDTTHDIYTVAYFMKYFTCSFLMCMVGLTIVVRFLRPKKNLKHPMKLKVIPEPLLFNFRQSQIKHNSYYLVPC